MPIVKDEQGDFSFTLNIELFTNKGLGKEKWNRVAKLPKCFFKYLGKGEAVQYGA